MPMPPTARDRWLALALLLAVLGLGYLLLVHPWFTVPWRAIDQEIVALQERQQRVQAQLDQQPQVEARLREVSGSLQQRPGFLAEATAEGAAAALGGRVQDAVLSASPGNQACVVSNRTPMPDNRSDAAHVRVAMQVRLRCGVDEMANVLHTLETGTPRLFVENLNILAQRFQQSPDEAGTGLDVSFELVGYLQPGTGASPVPAPPVDEAAAPPALDVVEPTPAPLADDAATTDPSSGTVPADGSSADAD